MIFKTSCSFKSKQVRMWLYNYFIIKKKFKKSTNGWLHSMWTVTSLLLPISLTFSPCCLVISRSVSQSNLFPTKRSSASSEAYCGILKEAAFQRWALSYPVRKRKPLCCSVILMGSSAPHISEHWPCPRRTDAGEVWDSPHGGSGLSRAMRSQALWTTTFWVFDQ